MYRVGRIMALSFPYMHWVFFCLTSVMMIGLFGDQDAWGA